jgi:hypothetical protein
MAVGPLHGSHSLGFFTIYSHPKLRRLTSNHRPHVQKRIVNSNGFDIQRVRRLLGPYPKDGDARFHQRLKATGNFLATPLKRDLNGKSGRRDQAAGLRSTLRKQFPGLGGLVFETASHSPA